MSGVLSALNIGLGALTSWRNDLRDGSFRGVPFTLASSDGEGGRRLAVHEFPLRDQPYTEDLGQIVNRFHLQFYVAGDDYMSQRDDLLDALQGDSSPGMLVHPTMGEISCRVARLRWTENPTDLGGMCAFTAEFVKEGDQPGPSVTVDTASQLIRRAASLAQAAITVYQNVSLMIQHPSLLLGFAGTLLGAEASALFGLPGAIGAGLAPAIAALLSSPGDDLATATATQAVFSAAADRAIAIQFAPPDPDDPVIGVTPIIAPAADPSGGLAALAVFGDALPAPGGTGAVLTVLLAQRAAMTMLFEGAATLAVLTVYASIDWPSAQVASAARVQLQALVDRQSAAAANNGADDLYRAWLAVGEAAAADLLARVQALPNLTAWAMPLSMPSLPLAQRWYQDASQAESLDALNDVPHPLFMPLTGIRLA